MTILIANCKVIFCFWQISFLYGTFKASNSIFVILGCTTPTITILPKPIFSLRIKHPCIAIILKSLILVLANFLTLIIQFR